MLFLYPFKDLPETFMSYTAPLKDMLFNIEHLARIDQIAQIPGFEDAGLETCLLYTSDAADE